MKYYENVNIPVFGSSAVAVAWTDPVSAPSAGVYFSDKDWLKPTNATRVQGVVEGIARSVDYNTILRQCSTMSSLFANILAYRNSLTRTGQGTPYGGSPTAPIGTDLITGEASLDVHIGAMSNIFDSTNFLADSEVTTRTINNLAVTTAKLAALAVTTDKINTNAVTKAKLGSDLVNTGSATNNGITVTLSQTNSSGNRGFVIGINSTKVTNAANADDSTNAANLKTTTSTANLYLCGTTSTAANTNKPFYNSASVYMSNGSQINATDFNVPSDRRLKENIEDVGKHQVRALVEGVKVKTFNYKNDPKRTLIGVIAQDVQDANTVIGDLLVEEDADTGMLKVHGDKMVYVLWDYVQQQAETIKKLTERVEALEKAAEAK
jgi:hypothetical protein